VFTESDWALICLAGCAGVLAGSVVTLTVALNQVAALTSLVPPDMYPVVVTAVASTLVGFAVFGMLFVLGRERIRRAAPAHTPRLPLDSRAPLKVGTLARRPRR
jgi:hypothetical protein